MDDFSHVHNRKATYSLKWDELQTVFNTTDILPMWVADMGFQAPNVVNEAIKQRADHGFYGYTVINNALKEEVSNWVSKHHNRSTQIDSLIYSLIFIPSINSAREFFTNHGYDIIIKTPDYTTFYNLIKNNNRNVIEKKLIKKDNKYEIDFEDF